MSWSSIKTEGIILYSAPFREADRQYTILTPDYGKLSFLGRGALKGKAKLASHLDPFALTKIELIRGRRSTTVISVDRSALFDRLRNSLEHRLLAQTSLHLVHKYTHDDAEDAELYTLVHDWLQFLESQQEIKFTRAVFLLGAFLLHILRHLGYEMQLQNCVNCREGVIPLSYRWHAGKGGLVCSDCVHNDKREWFAAQHVGDEVIRLLRFARDQKYDILMNLTLPGRTVEQFAQIVHDFIAYHVPSWEHIPFWTGILYDGVGLEKNKETG